MDTREGLCTKTKGMVAGHTEWPVWVCCQVCFRVESEHVVKINVPLDRPPWARTAGVAVARSSSGYHS